MIEVRGDNDNLAILISGKEADIIDVGENYILAECNLSDLVAEQSQTLPIWLELEIRSEDGFGTYFFDEVHLSEAPDGVAVAFRCHTPNKYWEGQFGLATFIAAIRDQVVHHDNWKVTQIELEDDWKGITLERLVALGDPLEASIRLGPLADTESR